ncbi:conserved exported hypothetical protein [Candidatus Sulfopaludibacter sp. SbA3]|nr:conserved exported hypothetical protein [Candidatus Sulfopaludibacter sp. SbA3]
MKVLLLSAIAAVGCYGQAPTAVSPAGGPTIIAANSPVPAPASDPESPSAKPSPPPVVAEAASPLQLKIGEVSIIPIGFMDATAVWRDKNAASGIGTNFASIPFDNVAAGHLSELRFSPQNSRLGLRADVNVHGAHIIGYNEFDFLGTSGGNNVGVTNGAFAPRLRLYWVDVRKGKWEVLGGQSWSMMTPNRYQISPLPGDVFFSQTMDVNYLVGLTWTRQPGFRLVYHPSERVTFGVALENPNQYIGGSAGAPTITLPSALSGMGGSQFDNSTNVLNTPNLTPDFIAKLAFDLTRRVHFELAGIERNFKDYNVNGNQTFTKAGGGGAVNVNVEVITGIRVISNNFVSDGGGRYLFGTVPDVILRADGSISPIHANSTTDGIEATFGKTLLFVYYGEIWAGRNTALDANGTSLLGYGFKGSANNQNRSMEEFTLGINRTLWKDAKWGGLSYIMQYEHAMREPWYVASGQPASAHDNTVYIDLRYTLPGAPPPVR